MPALSVAVMTEFYQTPRPGGKLHSTHQALQRRVGARAGLAVALAREDVGHEVRRSAGGEILQLAAQRLLVAYYAHF